MGRKWHLFYKRVKQRNLWYPDSFNSFCSIDMNTTIDSNANLLTYDEIAITNIINDNKDSFYKIKTTNVKDNSKELENVNKTFMSKF